MPNEKRDLPQATLQPASREKWMRFDVVARWLMLIAFAAFAVATAWNLRLVQQQLAQLETKIESQKQHTVEHDYWLLTHEGSTPELRTEAFLRLVRAGNTEWLTARLNNLNFDEASLAGVSLKYATFKDCSFKKAEMRGINAAPIKFESCDLIETDLQNAQLQGGQLFLCIIRKANLQNANLVKTSLEQSRFYGVRMFNAELSEADMLLTVFEDCDLQNVNLTSANLTNAKFIRTNLRLARLPDALLSSTDFTDSNWWRCRGLPPKTIDEFKRKFPPTKNAPLEFRQDWEKWIKTGG